MPQVVAALHAPPPAHPRGLGAPAARRAAERLERERLERARAAGARRRAVEDEGGTPGLFSGALYIAPGCSLGSSLRGARSCAQFRSRARAHRVQRPVQERLVQQEVERRTRRWAARTLLR